MRIDRCAYCRLPTRIHFAWCQESGIRGRMAPEALRPAAIRFEIRETRIRSLADWLAERGRASKKPEC